MLIKFNDFLDSRGSLTFILPKIIGDNKSQRDFGDLLCYVALCYLTLCGEINCISFKSTFIKGDSSILSPSASIL